MVEDALELRKYALQCSIDIERLPKQYGTANQGIGNGVVYNSVVSPSVDVIITRAAMIEAYLSGNK